MSAATVDSRVSEEQHARAVLASIAGAHHLPVGPDGIAWRPAADVELGEGRTLPMQAVLRVDTPAFADVDTWAAALKTTAEDNNVIVDPKQGDGSWFISRERRVVIRDWLPGVKLWVRRLEYRTATS